MADGLNLLYQRLQMYEGLSDDKLLYDYDRNLALGIALVVSKMTNLHYQPARRYQQRHRLFSLEYLA
ncbi:hypothetical protein PF586_02260 [Lactobacillus delbrueckii]|uniref:Uncharacterized protein n=1 Tax=Lactobacillus delbrueckii TaxID=1584 RepID=A0AAW5YT76_9LACO|nr:hypothetical protein [Lactobacillus delbrueckii]MCT2877894.1 hypothetical protein [Lactobacillus delbrueckii]MCT3491254.1 hypothetical protein [Lactobacillus delbrueckii]MDA3767316.1 hypothetical protein [Lactobacillus delbrueckii]